MCATTAGKVNATMVATRRAQTSSESRRLLVSAAAELFAEQGFRRTTFADIAERSGISRGSIPWHFGNKDGLLEAVIEELTTRWLNTPPPTDDMTESLDLVLEFVRQPATRLLITLVAEAVEPESPVHTFYAELHRSMRKWLSGWTSGTKMPRGVRREEFTTLLTGAIIGVHQQWRIAPDDVDLDRTLGVLKAVFLRA
jgi:TetR/AcrR family acrAB operon transcriptional repressor